MYLFNSKELDRHRRLYRRQRISHSQKSATTESTTFWTSGSLLTNNGNKSDPFLDVITSGNFEFVYDKSFLDELKQLTKELRLSFSTALSRSKARNRYQNIEQAIDCQKNDLIQRMHNYIEAIDQMSDTVREGKANPVLNHENGDGLQFGHNSTPNNSYNRYETTADEDYESDVSSQTSGDRPLFDPEKPLFTQQYIESLDSSKNFRFSSNSFSYNMSTTDVNSGYDSGVCSASPSQPVFQRVLQPIDSQNPYNSQVLSQNMIESTQQRLQIVNRHKWTNTNYQLSTGITLKVDPQNKVRTHSKRRKQLKFVLEKMLALIEQNVFCTKRDLYYQNVSLFDKSQRVADEIIDDLACSLKTSRYKLHVVSSTRGLVFGHLKFINTNGFPTDCLSSPNGINIPNDTERIRRMESSARFVLIIEKDATFQQLIDLGLHKKYPLIMITGHGYPDMNTRAFVHMLWNTFEIPIFGLVDGDAHGLEILCTFRHGSLALSYESHNLVAPAITWLGILPADIIDYELSPSVQIPLTDMDVKKIKDLLNRTYMKANPIWSKQLKILLRIGRKVEIQSLAEHWPTFLIDVYLPTKIRYGKWI